LRDLKQISLLINSFSHSSDSKWTETTNLNQAVKEVLQICIYITSMLSKHTFCCFVLLKIVLDFPFNHITPRTRM
jgi:hypothetical protein